MTSQYDVGNARADVAAVERLRKRLPRALSEVGWNALQVGVTDRLMALEAAYEGEQAQPVNVKLADGTSVLISRAKTYDVTYETGYMQKKQRVLRDVRYVSRHTWVYPSGKRSNTYADEISIVEHET